MFCDSAGDEARLASSSIAEAYSIRAFLGTVDSNEPLLDIILRDEADLHIVRRAFAELRKLLHAVKRIVHIRLREAFTLAIRLVLLMPAIVPSIEIEWMSVWVSGSWFLM